MTVFFSQLINGLSLGSIYALIALGYSCLLYTSQKLKRDFVHYFKLFILFICEMKQIHRLQNGYSTFHGVLRHRHPQGTGRAGGCCRGRGTGRRSPRRGRDVYKRQDGIVIFFVAGGLHFYKVDGAVKVFQIGRAHV